MHDINDMLLFAQVVKARSFSGAARRLEISKSRVSKAVARLEAALGVRLLQRSTRSLSLTEVGEVYFEHCDRMLDELAQAEDTIGRLHLEPRGKLKFSAPVAFSTLHVAPALADFMQRYPELKVDMTISDRLVDLVEEGYDIALRIAPEPSANLVAHRLAPIRRKICASPSYLAKFGVPDAYSDERRHRFQSQTRHLFRSQTHHSSPWLPPGTNVCSHRGCLGGCIWVRNRMCSTSQSPRN